MPDSVICFSITTAAISVLVTLWAVISVFRSDKNVGTKNFWELLIWMFPFIRLIIWGLPAHVVMVKVQFLQSTASNRYNIS